MATVIDSLIVSLGLDSKGFTKGQKEAVEALRKTDGESTRASRKMQDDGKKAAEFFAKVRNEVLAIGEAFMGLSAIKSFGGAFMGLSAIKSFVENITSGDAAVGRLAKNVDMSTEDVSAWEGAVQKAGGTAEGMAKSLQTVTQGFQDWQLTGTNPVMESMSKFGVRLLDTQGKLRPMNDILLESADILADVAKKRGGAAAQNQGGMMGFDEGTINLLMQGRSAVEALLAKQRAMNVITDRDSKQAQQRQVAWRNLVDTFTSLGRTLLNDVSPTVFKILTQFENWILKNKEWLATGITEGIKNIANWLKSIDWNAVKSGFNSLLTVGMGIVNVLSMIIDGWNKISELFGKSNIGEGVVATINKVVEGWAMLGDILGLNNETSISVPANRVNAGLITNNATRMNSINNSSRISTNTSTTNINGPINVLAPNAKDLTGATAEGIAAAHRKQTNRALNAMQLHAG